MYVICIVVRVIVGVVGCVGECMCCADVVVVVSIVGIVTSGVSVTVADGVVVGLSVLLLCC